MNIQGNKSNFEVLTAAREILSNPDNWHKGHYEGVNVQGEPCYCGAGAIGVVVHGRRPTQAERMDGAYSNVFAMPAFQLLERVNGLSDLGFPEFNDRPETTHSQMLASFDKAIEAAKAEEQTIVA